jgi:hypothetical protein
MRRLGLGRPSSPVIPPATGRLCHRCTLLLDEDSRVIEAEPIEDGSEPVLFHLGCAPAEDSLRWRARREIPLRVVREDRPG